ncbi:OTU domain-containing protein 4 isoform X2 [Lepisosteus oculatus]|uniref:OTU domain-containing protein 4 isoform X2 n=1 Tax=Lepisosteus oculatus TaxID=7918 RepID=UPI0035F516A9
MHFEMERGLQNAQTNDTSAEKLMDEYLKSLGLYRKKIAKDGSCLFRAVAEQVLLCQSRHLEVRRTCGDYVKKNRVKYESFIEGSFEEYLQRLENPQSWVGEVEISALALIYKHDFMIFQEPGKPPVHITENNFPDKIRLCFLNGNHYDSVYPKQFEKDAALCQSILYELLYERVFGADHNAIAACLQDCGADSEGGAEECESSEESGLDDEEWPEVAADTVNMNNFKSLRGRQVHKTSVSKPHPSAPTLPKSVRNSLNPSSYRNIEYDVWMRSKKAQQNQDYRIAAGMQFSVGDKCKVCLEHDGEFYNAYIQEVCPNNGPVTVFVEELGEKHTVPLRNLKPQAWSSVAEKGRRIPAVNGHSQHSDKDHRGARKSLKAPAKLPAAAPLYSQQAAPARGQQQPPVEDRALGRPCSSQRKCDPGHPCSKAEEGLGAPSVQEHLAAATKTELYQASCDSLHKDEQNFPALSRPSVCQAATLTSDGARKQSPQTAERQSSRRRLDRQDQPRENEARNPSPRSVQKGEKNKPLLRDLPSGFSAALLQGTEQPSSSTRPADPAPSPPAALPPEPPASCTAGVQQPMGVPSVSPLPAVLPEFLPQTRVNTTPIPPLPVPLHAVSQPSLPFPPLAYPYQDPLYPGFPLNEKEEKVLTPPFSYCRNGEDLPTDKSILRFFFNLGVKAYSFPMWPPHSYILPLHQAYLNVYAMQPKVPDSTSFSCSWVPEAPAAPRAVTSAAPAGAGLEHPSRSPPGLAAAHPSGRWEPAGATQPAAQTPFEPPPPGAQGRLCSVPEVYSAQPGVPLPFVHPNMPRPYLGNYSMYPPVQLGYPVQRFPSGNPTTMANLQISPAVPQEYGTATLTFGESVLSIPPVAAKNDECEDAQREQLFQTPVPLVEVAKEQVTLPTEDRDSSVGALKAEALPVPENECIESENEEESLSAVVTGSQASETEKSNTNEARGTESPRERAGANWGYELGTENPEAVEEDNERSETMPRSGKFYYGRSFRGKRGIGIYRDNKWRGPGRGYRGRRGLDERREYSYSEGRSGETRDYQNTMRGEKSGRYRGPSNRSRVARWNSNHGGDRDSGYAGLDRRNVTPDQ